MTKCLAGNWKMFKTRGEVATFFEVIGEQIKKSSVQKIVATSPTLLQTAVPLGAKAGIEIYSQNCAWDNFGALTGEISPLQLVDLGVSGTLIGHSERRQFFGETTATCKKRLKAALGAKLGVIYCLGESLEERKASKTFEVIESQITPVLEELAAHPSLSMIAYEPVWAIGTGLVASPGQIQEAHEFIGALLAKNGLKLPVLYGGSVKPENFREISGTPGVSGGLVGGASLDPLSYLALHQCLDN